MKNAWTSQVHKCKMYNGKKIKIFITTLLTLFCAYFLLSRVGLIHPSFSFPIPWTGELASVCNEYTSANSLSQSVTWLLGFPCY